MPRGSFFLLKNKNILSKLKMLIKPKSFYFNQTYGKTSNIPERKYFHITYNIPHFPFFRQALNRKEYFSLGIRYIGKNPPRPSFIHRARAVAHEKCVI